jgi:RNA recognition motif-containing protein
MDQKNKLYVGNLPFAIDNKQLEELFAKFGEVTEAIVIINKFNGRSKGFGFVTFKEEKDAETAIKEMNQAEVMERKLVVNTARPKKEDAPATNFTPTKAE